MTEHTPGDETPTTARQASDRPAGFDRWQAEIRATLAVTDDVRVDVYLRSLLPPPGAKETQVGLLKDLRETVEDRLGGDLSVDVWGERLCLCGDCRGMETGETVVDTVREFESWGDDYDATVGSFFERTRQRSSITGGTYEGIVPPRVTAALYVGESLCGVFPSRFEGEPFSVHDFSESLAAAARRPAVGPLEPR